MFSGIVEEMATVRAIEREGGNVHFTLTCSFVDQLKIDQSVSHNGVCLTVVKISGDEYVVTAMKETLDKSNLGLLRVGDRVNVVCLGKDKMGRFSFSIKDANKPEKKD